MPIRAAGPADASVLAELNTVVQQVHHEALPEKFKSPDPHATRGFFELWLARPETVAFVAVGTQSDEPVGYVLTEIVIRPETPLTLPNSAMYIHQIAVVPSEMRHAWGRALVRAVENEGTQRRIDEVRLDSWSFNHRAQGFFAVLGYTPFNVRVQKVLSPPPHA